MGADAGDVNGDGYGDIVVVGSVYEGGATGISASPVSRLTHGTSSGAGDVNGDGFDDVLVGGDPTVVYYGFVWTDLDGDGVYSTDESGLIDDCDDTDAGTFPGAAERESTAGCMKDDDGDGYGDAYPAFGVTAGTDCDDANAALHPGAPETDCGGTVDYNCDGSTGSADGDADGYLACQDCDDADASAHPSALEVAGDGVDEDCDGIESCFVDADADGYRTDAPIAGESLACDAPGEAVASVPAGDCDDASAALNPGASEVVADDIDENCDGLEACYLDADEDGYPAGSEILVESADLDCSDPGEGEGYAVWTSDCDDSNAAINADASEICNGVDDDCDGTIDDDPIDEQSWARDADGDGYTSSSAAVVTACTAPAGDAPVSASADCDDTNPLIHPDAEDMPGDGIDQDCDGEFAFTTRSACGCATGSGRDAGLALSVVGIMVVGRRRVHRRA